MSEGTLGLSGCWEGSSGSPTILSLSLTFFFPTHVLFGVHLFFSGKKKSWVVGQEKEPKTFIPPGKKLGGWRCDGEGERIMRKNRPRT